MKWLDDRALRGLKELIGQGDVLDGRWELLQPIGEGGMAVVHAALDRETGREVAVKILRAHDDEARLLREVRALEGASHPAIVKYVAHGEHDGARFVVMERLVGATLGDRLRRGPLSFADTVAIAERIAGGLAAVHEAGITHRDLKPANVFLAADSVLGARLVDFGLARRGDTTTLTGKGALVGTPGYMAPEQVRGDGEVGPPADVFSFGCILWECISGRPPFVAEDDETLFARILLAEVPSLDETPPAFAALVGRMLDKEAMERPPAAALAKFFRELAACTPRTQIAEGDVIAGKYRVEGFLGAGGMGTVVAAVHLELGTRVALKLLRTGAIREARAASQLESEHVARVLDVGKTDDGTPFLVMEHLSGTDLAQRLATNGPFEVEVAIRYLRETCRAIAEAHALGIVHRDLKPSNLFLAKRRSGEEIVKVLDFGISKTRDDEGAPEHGSRAYMAPEKTVDARSDIYSLGVVLHELVTGKRPDARAKESRARETRIPTSLVPIIARCLQRDPEKRFQSVSQLEDALATPRRRIAPAMALVALSAVVVGFAVWPTEKPSRAITPTITSSRLEPISISASVSPAPTLASTLPAPAEAARVRAGVSSTSPSAPRAPVPRPPASAPPPSSADLDLRDPMLLER